MRLWFEVLQTESVPALGEVIEVLKYIESDAPVGFRD